MSRFKFQSLAIAVALSSLMLGRANATTIAQWNPTATVTVPPAAAVNTLAPTAEVATANASATQLGMTNSYTYANGEGPGSTAQCDIDSTAGTAVPGFSEDTWRIRGNSNAKNAGPGMANGWNTAAPQYSQGAEFDINTTGYSNLSFVYDWYCTTQGITDLMEQYTTNGSTWVNFLPTPLVATANDYYDGDGFTGQITMNLSGTPGVNNNPNFGIRLVSAYDPTYTGAGAPTYTAASGPGTTVYNNNSGNWRFGDLTLSGTAVPVPEPSSIALLFMGAAGLVACLRRKK